MYFKFSIRKNPKTLKLCSYFRLVESYRNMDNRICHRTILNVGFLEDIEAEQLRIVQQVLTERSAGKKNLLIKTDETATNLIENLWSKIVSEKRIDLRGTKALPKKNKTVDIEITNDKQVRELGKEWLCYQCLKQLDLLTFLENLGWGEEQIQLTFTQIICRASYPASELKRSKIIQQISAVCEITGFPITKISKDILYRNAKAIFKEKDLFEAYLSKKINEIFGIKDETVLYNITNIYFEDGKHKEDNVRNNLLQESKIIILAMVINQQGFLKYSNVFEGNIDDVTTIHNIVANLRLDKGEKNQKTLLIIDANIATDKNLRLLEEEGYNYICVSRSTLKNYQVVRDTNPVVVVNQNMEQFILQKVIGEKSRDYYLKEKNLVKDINISGIRNQFETRVVEELQKLNKGITNKHGVKSLDIIKQKIGRVLEKYPNASRCFTIKIADDGKNKATEITWEKNEKFRLNKKELGVYFIRTNLPITDENLLWETYHTITDIESSFRTIKTNIDLYPVYHKNDDLTLAHLHLDLLAHWIINSVRYQLKGSKINHSWQEILKIATSQKLVITSTKNQFDETVITKRSSEPTKELSKIITALKYKHYPFTKRVSVLKTSKPKQDKTKEIKQFTPLEIQMGIS